MQVSKSKFNKISAFIIFALLLSPLVFSQSAANQVNKIIDADNKACNFMLSTSDWRVLSAIALLLSTLFIAAMYMYGSVVDSSFKDRAKVEMYNLVFTGILLIFFTFILNLMCNGLVSSLFQIDGSAYEASYNYLHKLSTDYIKKTATFIAIGATSLSMISSTEIGGDNYKKTSTFLSFTSDPVSFFSDATFALFSSLILAYIVTISQINVLALIPSLSLLFFIPIGIIFRSLYPFRKFGGALIGLGIGLYVFVPIVLLFDNMLLQQVNMPDINLEQLQLQCQDNSDCFSHTCQFSQDLGFKVCMPLKDAGEFCNSDFECKSGVCLATAGGKKCFDCGVQDSINPICCPGFVRNETTGLCTLAKSNGELCSDDKDCISNICKEMNDISVNGEPIMVKKCIPKKTIGETCSEDKECISNTCGGIAPNKVCQKTLISEQDKQAIISRYAVYIEKAPDEFAKSNFEVTNSINSITNLVNTQQYEQVIGPEVSVNSQKNSMGLFYDLIILPIVIVFIFGVLLPLLEVMLVSRAVLDLSAALGEEIEIAKIWRLI